MSLVAMENNLIATIKGAFGARLRAVETLPGDWDDDTLKRLLRGVPGVFMTFAGWQSKGIGGTLAYGDGTWVMYAATGHASGEAARRRGDSQQIGAYEIVWLLMALMHGHTIPGEGTLAAQRVENLYNGEIDKQGVCVYACTFTMPMSMPADVDLSTLDAFETFAAQYDVPPLTPADHPAWLVGDYSTSNPDARDTVALPQP